MEKTRNLICPGICTVTILVLFRTLLLLGYVPSSSMSPTITPGSLILGLRRYGELERGDIIIFERNGELLVKRIAATGSDVIEKDGQTIPVPNGSYYVLGDNAENSCDSRYWADPFVPDASVVAKLICYTKSHLCG